MPATRPTTVRSPRLGAVDFEDPHFVKSTEQGAATSVWCATSAQLEGMGGVYCEDFDIAEAVPADFPVPRGVRPWAMDPELAERLWKMSEAWTGVALAA